MASLVFALPAKQGTILSWTAPTTNTDGSPLTNLGGYKIYWKATAASSYTDAQSKDVGNVTTATIQSVTGSSTTVYYMVVTAYNTLNVESALSDEVRNSVPLAPSVPGSFRLLVQ